MRIRHQLLLVLALVALLPVIVAGVLAYRLSVSRLHAQADANLTTVARRIASEVDSFAYRVLDRTRSDALIPSIVNYVASDDAGRAADEGTVARLLQTAVIPDPVNVGSCALFDSHGNKLLDTSPAGPHVHDESGEPWIQRPLKEGVPVLVSEVDGIEGPSLWVGAPLRDSRGATRGVLRLRYELSALQQIVTRLAQDTGLQTTALIVGPNGAILAQGGGLPNLEDVSGILPASREGGQPDAGNVHLSWARYSHGTSGGPRDRVASMTLHNVPWAIAVVQTPESYEAASREFGRTLLLLGALVTGLVLISGYIAAQRISRPITDVAAAANELDAGRLERVVPERGAREVKALALALNHMTSRLSGTLQKLEERATEFQAIVEGSPVAMGVIDEHGRFSYLNAAFVSLVGYTREEIPDLNTWWRRAYPDPAYRREIIARVEEIVNSQRGSRNKVTEPIQATITCKDGSRRDIEFRSLWMGNTRLTTFTDLTTHKQTQKVREILLESLGGLSGRAFFERLALEAGALLGAERVFIGRFVSQESDALAPLVAWHLGVFMERPMQHTTGGPAEVLRRDRRFVYWPDVAAAFPSRASDYRAWGIASYAGLPLRNPDGDVVGTISVMFSRPLSNVEPVRAAMELLAARAAMELDRLDAAEVLRKSEERYRTLVTYAPDAIVVFDLETGKFVDCNSNAEQMFGFSRDQLLEKGPIDLSPPEQPDGSPSSSAADSFIAEAMKGHLQTFEWTHRDSTGREFPCEVRLVRMPDPNRKLIRGSLMDISDRKLVQEKIRQSEHRFAMLFNMSPVGKVISNPDDGMIIDANPAACELIGKTPEEVIGTCAPSFTNWKPEERQRIVAQIIRERKPLAAERVLRRSDGRNVTALIHFNYIELDGVGRLLSSIIDITDRKRAEDVLRENEERFRLLVENSNELVMLVSPDGTALYASPNHAAITGYTPEELVGKNAFTHVHPDDMPAIAAKRNLPSASVLFRYRFKDGTWHWLESSARGFTLPSGEQRIVIMSRDVSARVAADDARKGLETQLRQAQKLEAIGTLAGGIAHDFNNILTGVMGHVELALLDLPKTHALRGQLQDALNACKRARDLISQMLTFSRQREPSRQPTSIGPVVKEAMRLLRASLPSTIEIHIDIDDRTPPVDCDVTQLHQVVMNIGTNAAHAMPTGGLLSVSLQRVQPDAELLRRHAHVRPDHTICLSISDTGCGMDDATLERIFDPFFTTKAPGEGTGLGLPVVHGIMQEHGGAIVVTSTPDKGSCFSLYFPPAVVETKPAAAPPRDLRGALSSSRGRRVLLVDDEITVRSVSSRILERLGCEVTQCASAVGAFKIFKQDPSHFDLVLTDLTMPEMTGVDLARECRALRPNVAFIIMTGYLKSAEIDHARAIGLKHFLRKPFDLDSLTEILEAAWSTTQV